MAWFLCWMIALSTYKPSAGEATDHLTPSGWTGNPWGPAAQFARETGQLPPISMTSRMARWDRWAKSLLRDGDIVFRLGDARTLNGWFPLSHFIAQATASRFSHTGIVAVEDGLTVVYDCSSSGIQRQPFAVWMLDCVGPLGVKRLRHEHRGRIPGVLAFCRKIYEQQVPFDYEFRLDDSKLYCLEMTENAFRSQGLTLSEPVPIGDWENLIHYPITAFAFVKCSALTLPQPITLDQMVYLPGNDRQGMWASSLLETVFDSQGKQARQAVSEQGMQISLRGDLSLVLFVAGEIRRSYEELPVSWMCELVLTSRLGEPLSQTTPDREADLNPHRRIGSMDF